MLNENTIYNMLDKIRSELLTIEIEIAEKNKNGKQFDFVTSPKLAHKVDAVKNRIDSINSKVYQES